jgi:hypothetical protein
VTKSDQPLKAIFYSPDAKDAEHIMANYKWLQRVSRKEWTKAVS